MLASIVIPVRNRASLIPAAVQSCLAQTCPDIEVIVVDDASTDSTPAMIRELAASDPRIRCICLSQPTGGQGARIAGILASRAEYVVFLDSDDQLTADSIAVRMPGFQDKEVGLVYGDLVVGDEPPVRSFAFPRFDGWAWRPLLREMSLCPASVLMIRRSALAGNLPSADFPAWQDDDLVLTVARSWKVVHCGTTVARSVAARRESITTNEWRKARGCKQMVRKYGPDIRKEFGYGRWTLWLLRIVLTYLRALAQSARTRESVLSGRHTLQSRAYGFLALQSERYAQKLHSFLAGHFEWIWT